MDNPNYFSAVHSLVGGQMNGPADGPVTEIQFFDNQKPPSESEINAELKRLQAEYDANQYQRDRVLEYPSIPDQLDEIYHNGIDSWKAIIKQTKDKYPKG